MSKRPTNRRPAGRPTRKKKVSMIDRLLARIPLSHAALHRVATWAIVLGVLGGVYVAGRFTGVNEKVGVAIAEEVGKAGFRVDDIRPVDVKRMDIDIVYKAAEDQIGRPMPLVDLDLVRNRLLQYGWVEDAHVSRRLPNILLIRIVERTPVAIWQYQGQLSLIDRGGHFLEPVSRDAMPDLPLVIGPGADQQEPAYQDLMLAAPALKPKVRAATWVGNRRWDLLFDTGETLSLPEGGEDAAKALRLFAEKDGTLHLLGRGFQKFDLRDPTRMVVRKPDGSTERTIGNDSTGTNTAPRGNQSDGADTRTQV